MTTPAVRTVKRGGSRYYVHPVTREKAVGVTSVVGMLPKEFLKFWAAKVVAQAAVDSFGEVAGMVARGDREGAVDYLKRAQFRSVDGAAVKGTEVHEMTERIDEAGAIPKRMSKDLVPYARGYLAFREETEAEILEVETTVWNTEHNYSGTLDRSLSIPEAAFALMDAPPSWYEGADVPILGDVKTTRSGVHAEVALQLAAYRAATERMVANSEGGFTPEEWPYHAKTGLVIHLRPDSWQLVPVSIGEHVFDIFTHLLQVFYWEKELKDEVLYPALAGADWTEEDVIDLEKWLKRAKAR